MSPSSYTCRQSLILSGGELLAIPPGTGQITQLYFRVDCEQSQFMPTPSSVMNCVKSIVTSNCTHMMDIGLRCVLGPSAGGGIDGIIPPAHYSIATIPLQSLTKPHLLSLPSGAIVGTGVGVAAVVIILLLLCVTIPVVITYCVMKKKMKSHYIEERYKFAMFV